MTKGKKINPNLSGGYVGEKEIKSAGNKIYKIIHSPDAQNLGKAALLSLITLAIGSTIKSGIDKSKSGAESSYEPAVGAPPPVIERQPDIYDSNPLLHFAGLGLKEDANKALKDIKSKYDTDISPAVKSAGDKIYKLITSPEAQSLGKAGLGLLILLAIGSQGEKIANFGNEMADAGRDYTEKVANLTIGKKTGTAPERVVNLFPQEEWEQPEPETPAEQAGKNFLWTMMLDIIHRKNAEYRAKENIRARTEQYNRAREKQNTRAGKFIKKHPIIKDIHDHVKGGMFDKTKKTLKSASDKIYKAFTSPTAQNLGKVALTLLLAKAVTKAIPAAVVASEEMSRRSAEYKNRQDFNKRAEAWEREREIDARKRELDEAFSADINDTDDRFSHFAGFGLPKHLHKVAKAHHPHLDKLSTKMADSIEYLKKSKVNKKYLPFLISNILSAGVLIAKGGKVSKDKTEQEEKKEHQTIWTKYIKPTTDKIYDVATSDEVKTSVKGIIYLLLTLIVADQVNKLGVAINRGLVETLTQRGTTESQARRDLFNLGMSDVSRVPEGYKGEEFPKWDDNTDSAYRARVLSALENKYKSDKAEEKHTKDALLKLSKDLGVSVSAKQVGRPQGSLGKSRIPVKIAVAKEESKDEGLGLFHGGDFQNNTARIRTAISDSTTKFKNQLNKLYRDITSEYGKKMTKNALLALAGLAFTGAVGIGAKKFLKPAETVLQRGPPNEDYDTRMYNEGFRDFL
jgi:hypothetical protein